MKYEELSNKILEIIYQEPDEKIYENILSELLSIKEEDLKHPLQYLEKLGYIKIRQPFSFSFMGGDMNGQLKDAEKGGIFDTISLTNKGIKYCENKNITPIPEATKPNNEVNIFSKNDFLSKNTVEKNSISGSESILGRVISFLKGIFIK